MALASVTLADLSKHRTPQDAWVAIHGKVYDVSKFFEDHPGGGEVLMSVAGTDATEEFDYVDHSDDAFRTMEKIEVGVLTGWVKVKLAHPARITKEHY
ncbi:Cytochrome b5 [Cytospora mali]|uniref:Cytochrome b5 n=1 Tax=Cytospora mali TaxID=578113 RepID=A0A194W8X1_CYTMA|nr:Cytochrome b5 [Valsa mali]